MNFTREQAFELLSEYTRSESLIKHALAVEAAMRAYAGRMGEDKEKWGICGLLHDFDYEKYPTKEGHPLKGSEILREKGYPEEIIEAILGHAAYTGVERKTPMAKVLFAVDELAGFVMAVAYVRPEKLEGMKPKSVNKKLKDSKFAAGVSREDIAGGIKELGVDQSEHIQTVIDALHGIKGKLWM